MKLEWSRLAAQHLQALHRYIAADSPSAAVEAVERVLSAVEWLRRYPMMGRAGRVEATRELVIAGTPYLIAYRLLGDRLTILAVLHASRKWPEGF